MNHRILFLAALICLSGCGIKPKDVDAPSGRDNSGFPHTYPAPTDSKK